MASSRSKEETTEKGDRAGLKRKCQNGRRCHGPAVALMVASMVASMASMVASMASMVLMALRATMVLASAALKAPKAGVSDLRWSKLRNKLLVYHPEDLLVRRWSYNCGMKTVVHELGLNSIEKLAVFHDVIGRGR